MKILVIGFQRSGTTLLRRLFNIHPDIVCMLHEKKVLKNKINIETLLKGKTTKFGVDINQTWGEKVPWFTKSGSDIVRYTKEWLSIFESDARIIHVTRHPQDVANSNYKTFKVKNKKQTMSNQEASLKRIRKEFSYDKRYMEITFEELVTEPRRVLTELFKFCKLDHSKKTIDKIASAKKDKLRYFDGINPDRAFAYRREGK